MLKIYGANLSSPSNKVRYVANYIGLEYEYTQVKIREGENKKEWFLKLNPAGKIPAIDDNGFGLFESGAICRYLASKNKSPLYPADVKQQATIDQWTDYAIHHVGLGVSKILFNTFFYKFQNVERDERSYNDGKSFLSKSLPIVDQQLGKNKYLAGNSISLADMSLLAALDPADVCEIDLSQYPNLTKWRNTLKKESFYQKCHKEYGEALKQTAK